MLANIVLISVICITFALVVVMHVGILAGLIARKAWWYLMLGVLVPLTAPYVAFVSGMRIRAGIWSVGMFFYGIALGLSFLRA